MFCKYCGAQVNDGALYCAKCGGSLPGRPVDKTVPPSARPEDRQAPPSTQLEDRPAPPTAPAQSAHTARTDRLSAPAASGAPAEAAGTQTAKQKSSRAVIAVLCAVLAACLAALGWFVYDKYFKNRTDSPTEIAENNGAAHTDANSSAGIAPAEAETQTAPAEPETQTAPDGPEDRNDPAEESPETTNGEKIKEDDGLQEEYNAFDAMIESVIREAQTQYAAYPFTPSGNLIWPLQYGDAYVSSGYGYRTQGETGYSRFHGGVDSCCLSGTDGKDVSAAANGVVLAADYDPLYGFYVLLDHGNGICTLYGHNSRLLVSAGETVSQGQVIAKAGSTGYSEGPHCHFEVWLDGQRTDPTQYVTQP